MEEQIKATPAETSFDYELYEGDPDHLRTVVATPMQPSPRIEPASLKFKYRVGRGYLGEVWSATHHQSADDYDEYHEVAVKMLHPIKDDYVDKFLRKFEDFWINSNSCPQLHGVCCLHGISIISGKICIVMKFYDGSIGDLIGRVKGAKLQVPDVLRYGIQLIKGIQELHSLGLLVLNLKPTNFLLNGNGQAVIGDFGLPYLLLGIPLADPDLASRLGTPSYMAPEQWQPEVRGPITYETDSWGFGCSIVEMLTGVRPWFGKSIKEIYESVVMRGEKPQIPSGLPPAVQNILYSCFEYDFRHRPLMTDILQVFERSLNAFSDDDDWIGLGSTLLADKSLCIVRNSWSLSKDHLQVGDLVRSRKSVNSCNSQKLTVTEGTVVGLEKDTDQDGCVLVRIPSMQNPLRLNVSTLERVTYGFAAGDWVRLVKENKEQSSVGILHSIERDGSIAVGFLGLETMWRGHCSDVEMAEAYHVGYFVRLKANVTSSRFEWPHKRGGSWASGRVSQVLPNGCLVVSFPAMFTMGGESKTVLADPAEVERVSLDTCTGMVEKYQHIEDFHWAVRPLAIALGVFMVGKLGIFVGKNLGKALGKEDSEHQKKNGGQGGSSSPHRRPSVARILF